MATARRGHANGAFCKQWDVVNSVMNWRLAGRKAFSSAWHICHLALRSVVHINGMCRSKHANSTNKEDFYWAGIYLHLIKYFMVKPQSSTVYREYYLKVYGGNPIHHFSDQWLLFPQIIRYERSIIFILSTFSLLISHNCFGWLLLHHNFVILLSF